MDLKELEKMCESKAKWIGAHNDVECQLIAAKLKAVIRQIKEVEQLVDKSWNRGALATADLKEILESDDGVEE